MNQILNQFWTPILTLLGVLVGGLLTGFFSILNSYFQAVALDEREKNKLILGKLEELFDTIEVLRIYHKNSLFTFHRYLIRTEAVPVAMPSDENLPTVKILALVSFYAPELEPKLNQLLQDISEFSSFQKDVLLLLKSGESGQDKTDQLTINGQERMSRINQSCLDMQKEISVISKKYI